MRHNTFARIIHIFLFAITAGENRRRRRRRRLFLAAVRFPSLCIALIVVVINIIAEEK